jgi:predicted signal transduction protein with EAL and GGDEF domain
MMRSFEMSNHQKLVDAEDAASQVIYEAAQARRELHALWLSERGHVIDLEGKLAAQDAQHQSELTVLRQAIERVERERDEARGLLARARETLEYWTPDESMVTPREKMALDAYYDFRDEIDAALGS